jgi:type I restriction enzyme S subunit
LRNVYDKKENLLGVSVSKVFMKSIANTVGTDFKTYKVVKRGQFTYIPDTSRRGEKIGIALLDSHDEGLVSPVYTVFEVTDTDKLCPEYLMMWFRRPEFDRYARFISHGSVREVFEWEDMKNVSLPLPAIEKQREIVAEYHTVQNRIALNNQLIQTLETTAQALYKQWFVEFEFPNEAGQPYKSSGGEMVESELGEIPKGWIVKKLGSFCTVKGGKRLPKDAELNDLKSGNPYIRVADMARVKFVSLNEKFQHVDAETQKSIARYIVSANDVILSIVGTIGTVNMIDETLHHANLTENCVRLTNFKGVSGDFIYHYLSSPVGQRVIETYTVGGVQAKLPLYNIQSIPIICPVGYAAEEFEKVIVAINSSLKNYSQARNQLMVLRDLLLSKLATIETTPAAPRPAVAAPAQLALAFG